MLIIGDDDFDAAVESLRNAGFRDAPWSYYSVVDPQSLEDEEMKGMHQDGALQYRNLDDNSMRFQFPLGSKVKIRAVLLRSSYTHLSLRDTPDHRFAKTGNIYYPDKDLLVESFAKTAVREPSMNMWTGDLEAWAISYAYGWLKINDTALDSICDEAAKAWFNERILRDKGGLDRTTVTKRVGKKYNTSGEVNRS